MNRTLEIRKDECNYLDITRVIGIYLVIMGHFWYTTNTEIYALMIYTFHMPLFFVVAGILHRSVGFSVRALANLAYALLLPYVIYFAFGACMNAIFNDGGIHVLQELRNMIKVSTQVNIPIWFFVSLFGVKVMAMLCKKRWHFAILTLFCLLALWISIIMLPQSKYLNIFKIQSTLIAFPFFAFGYLIKDKLNIGLSNYLKAGFVLLAIFAVYALASTYGGMDMRVVAAQNFFLSFVVTVVAIVGVILLSQLLLPYLKSDLVKTLSRGTMLIVGLHFPIMTHLIVPYTQQHAYPLLLLYGLLLLLLFYFPIKFLYMRVPILFGKRK